MDLIIRDPHVDIIGFPVREFTADLEIFYRSRKINKLFSSITRESKNESVTIHKFFLPEIIFILNSLPHNKKYTEVIKLIMTKSWMERTEKEYPSRINEVFVKEQIKYELKPYQENFLKQYDNKKQKYDLKGYILSFEQGLGKTVTSLSLMTALKKEIVIIICPKSIMNTVWENEIITAIRGKQDIWLVGNTPREAKYYIANYESIDKLLLCLKYMIKSENIGIIIDECHNFRNVSSKRVLNLVTLAKIIRCNDILLMSGTPIKALGSEMIPALQLIDPFFDKETEKIFDNALGLSKDFAIDILKNRIGIIMHRKVKKEVLSLPNKLYKEVKIKMPGSEKYELDTVKLTTTEFVKEREQHYRDNYVEYETYFNECIEYAKVNLSFDEEFSRYLEIIDKLKRLGYRKELSEEITWCNSYESRIVRPILTSDLKKKFDKSKAVIKYVDLKIMGEVIGGLLNRLRAEMVSEMVKYSPICEIIRTSIKKTICFTTFVEVVKTTEEFLETNCKLKSISIYGESSGSISSLVDEFKSDKDVNPLIATIQTLSTGVTLVEANTVIFLNQPWRYTDRSQAEDRVHRIGQDETVYIYSFILDTGTKDNLSTRMDSIINWSKDLFYGIIGDDKSLRYFVSSLLR